MTPFAMAEATVEAPVRQWDDPTGPDPEALYEMVRGKLVEKPSMAGTASEVTTTIAQTLGPFARNNGLGRVLTELSIVLDDDGALRRRPDLAFISAATWPLRKRAPIGVVKVSPELVIEVISPSNLAGEMLGKVREYFDAGILQVWVVYPVQDVVHVFEAFDRIRVVQMGGELDGGEIIPGFKLPLAELFAGEPFDEPNVD